MNKRIFLNVMIVAMLTFYMIFNIVYQRLINKHEPEAQVVTDIWEQPFLVPGQWQLTRIEMTSIVIQVAETGKWSTNNKLVDATMADNIAKSWQNLQASEITDYQQLPLDGKTILAFVEEDSQPLVFRLVEQAEKLHFYRMIDQKQFSFPLSAKSLLLPE